MTASTKPEPKRGILLFNLGGPDSLEAVEPFLYNLFSDPDIIRLPFSWLLQKPIAWSIASSRAPEVKTLYEAIGGRSPIVPLTESQGLALEAALQTEGINCKTYIAMRYWHPFTEEAVEQILRDGIEELYILPLYPQFSYTTTGSSMNEFLRVLRQKLQQKGTRPIPYQVIPPYYVHPGFLAAMANTIETALEKHTWSCPKESVQILFSAHSLPKKFVEKTRDPYPQQIMETAKQIMEQYFPNNPWELAYQSKVGKMPWLGPATDGIIHYFAAQGIENVLVVPIAFVSDHLETLYEIDQLYLGLAQEIGIPHTARAEALNSNPIFIKALAQLVQEAIQHNQTQSSTAPIVPTPSLSTHSG